MKLFILVQYFIVTMVITVTVGLFVLKPVPTKTQLVTAQVSTVTYNLEVESSSNAPHGLITEATQ